MVTLRNGVLEEMESAGEFPEPTPNGNFQEFRTFREEVGILPEFETSSGHRHHRFRRRRYLQNYDSGHLPDVPGEQGDGLRCLHNAL